MRVSEPSCPSAGESNSKGIGGFSRTARRPPCGFLGCWGGDERGSVSRLFCTTGRSAPSRCISNLLLDAYSHNNNYNGKQLQICQPHARYLLGMCSLRCFCCDDVGLVPVVVIGIESLTSKVITSYAGYSYSLYLICLMPAVHKWVLSLCLFHMIANNTSFMIHYIGHHATPCTQSRWLPQADKQSLLAAVSRFV